MVRRIRPVSRVLRIAAEVRSAGREGLGRETDLPGLDRVWAPPVDLYETAEAVVVEAELPGVVERDIRIVLHGGRLEIRGLKRDLPSGARFHRLEREYGTFRRVVLIPAAVRAEEAGATLENGILTVVLPKPPRRSRTVEVRGAGKDE